MSTQSISDILLDILKPLPRVQVTSIPAPDLGRNSHRHRIVGIGPNDVQREITRLMDMVENATGQGSFVGPVQIRAGADAGFYEAEGFTQIVQFAEAAE
ncbi:MAG: hypothetical protein ABIO35_08465 [Nitrobacter sp.]